ncbi:MAG: hypothetical protein L3J02_04420 [Henriciella sp.]|nr:hypothetical protein [Henriciella sp.]
MPIYNKILIFTAMLALFSAPVFADGTPGQRINHGPAPLQAHNMPPPEPGCVLIEGNTWSCPVPKTRYTHAPSQTTRTTQTVRRSAPTTTRRTYTRTVPATTTTRRTRTVAAPSTLTLDLASFSGGVGNGVDGGFYGGGGIIILGGDRRFSGVLSHAASAFTFRQRRGGGGGCGCMGGGD